VRVACLLMLLVVVGCAPRANTVAPYRDDPAKGDARAARGAAAWAARGAPLPPRPFYTDGCSAWPDSVWVGCCVEHDITYWCGGSPAQRLGADRDLRACVDRLAGPTWATLMYWGVRLGGAPRLPFGWRWGYGWSWRARVPGQ
jgi:hypothetical protein